VCNATLAEAYAQELQTPWLALSSKRQGARPSGIALPRNGEKWRSDLVESVIGEAYCASVLNSSSSSNKPVRLDGVKSGMVQRLVCCCLRSETFLQCVHGDATGAAAEMMHANTFDCLQGSDSDSDSNDDSHSSSEIDCNVTEGSDIAASFDSCTADSAEMQLEAATAAAADHSKSASVSTAKRRAAEQRRQHVQSRDHVCDISAATASAAAADTDQCAAPQQWQQQFAALLSSFDQKLSTVDEQQQQQRSLLYAHYGHSLIKLKVTSFLYAALSSATPRELTFKRQACLRAATLRRAVELLTTPSNVSSTTAAAEADTDAAVVAAAVLRLRCAVSTATLQHGDFLFAAKVAVLLLALSGAVHADAITAFAVTTTAAGGATASAGGAVQLAPPLTAVLQLLTRPPWTAAQLPQISQAMQRLFGCAAAASTTSDAYNSSKRARAGSVETLRCSTPPVPMTEQEVCYSRRIAAMQKSSRRLLARLAAMDYIAEYELLLTDLVLTSEVTSDMHTATSETAIVHDNSSAAVQNTDSTAQPQCAAVSATGAAVAAADAVAATVAGSSSTTAGVLTVCISDPFQRQVLHCLCELHGFRSVSRVVPTANTSVAATNVVCSSSSGVAEQQCKAVCVSMVSSSVGWPQLPLISASTLQEQLG
jgi:hypothetical protein